MKLLKHHFSLHQQHKLDSTPEVRTIIYEVTKNHEEVVLNKTVDGGS